jgi:hypothetical protein
MVPAQRFIEAILAQAGISVNGRKPWEITLRDNTISRTLPD